MISGKCQHVCSFEGANLYSSLAQSVEHAAVNRSVVGSSPTGGAFFNSCKLYVCRIFLYIIKYRVHKTIQMEGFYEGIEFWVIKSGLCISG